MAITIDKLRVRNKVFGYGIRDGDIQALTELGEKLKKYKPEDKICAKYKKWVVNIHNNYYDGLIAEIEGVENTSLQKYKAMFSIEGEVYFTYMPSYDEYKGIETLRRLQKDAIKHRYWSSNERAVVIRKPEDILEYKKDMFFQREPNDEVMESEEFVKTLCEVYDRDYTQVQERMSKKLHNKMNRIILVIERKNKRLYAYKTLSSSDRTGLIPAKKTGYVKLAVLGFDELDYNYIDEDREFYQEWGKRLYLFDDLKIEDCDVEMLRRIRDEDDDLIIINNSQYISYGKRLNLYDLQEKRKSEIEKKYETEIKKRVTDVKKKAFTYNDIQFSNDGVEFEGLKLSVLKKNGKSGDYNSRFVENISLNESTDFNDIFTKFVSGITGHIVIEDDVLSVEAIMGKVNIKYEKRDVLSYVNDKRINQDDVTDVLMRALCFDTTEYYDQFLTDISKVSLKYHTALANGLIISFYKGGDSWKRRRTTSDEDYIMRLMMKRKGNAYHIVYKKKEFKINNSNRMLNLTKNKEYRRTNTFEDVWAVINDCLPDTSEEEKMLILKDGLKEHKRAEERAEKLFQKTMKNLNIKEGTMKIKTESKERKGYIVPGKLRTYFLGDDLKVFDYKTQKYFCIVDTEHSKRVKKDKFVNRMLALANDQHLVKAISTL